MGTIFTAAILLIICAFAIKGVIHRIRFGSACCGERDALPKRIRPSDRNKSHYPYRYTLAVDGMRCSNCTRRIENAMNSTQGIWATASLQQKSLTVLSKTQLEHSFLKQTIARTGYTVMSVTEETNR